MALKFEGNKIIIKTDKDIKELESKMAQIQLQYEPFSVFALTTIINEEIVDKIQDRMRSKNVSQKVIDTTFLDANIIILGNSFFFRIKSIYKAENGFAVAVMIEDGRDPYIIKAPEPTPERPRPHLTPIIDGEQMFLKEAKIPRFTAQKNVKSTIQRRTGIVQRRLNRETKRWINQILRS